MNQLEGDGEHVQPKKSNIGKIIGIGCLVVIVLGLLASGGCYLVVQWGLDQGVSQMSIQLESAVEDRADTDELSAKIAEIQALSEAGELSFWAKTAWVTSGQPLVVDNKIDDEEAVFLAQLMDIIIAAGGDLSLEDATKYMEN